MALVLSILIASFAGFCVWVTVGLVYRGEWSKLLAFAGGLLLLVYAGITIPGLLRGRPFPDLIDFIFFYFLAGIGGLLLGARLIWLVVRWTNRHDDSRYAKRPPDPP
jgi:hypothetical protein